VASTQEDLSARLDRLERDFRVFSSEVSASMRTRGDALNRISLMAWLQISGPTIATMVFGFTLLWNAQQAQTSSMLDVQRSVGRLEGSISGLDTRVGRLEGAITGLDTRVGRLEGAITGLDTRVGRLEGAISRLDSKIDKLATAIDALTKRLGSP
jgi:outer membrane murein-binding lipoprotein Lpp